MTDVIWDMETGDPDDFLTLLLLCGHPQVKLLAVTVTPGTPEQVGLVRKALSWFDLAIPVGAYDIASTKKCVSSWHYKAYGQIPSSQDALPGAEVLQKYCNQHTTLITGAPLKNLGKALQAEDFVLGRLVAQGGFAGQGVVPPDKQLKKFQGKITCPTYNLNGDPNSALRALASPKIATRRFVSKNVCHKVYYDQEMHQRFAKVKNQSLSLSLIYKGMDIYLRKKPSGKKFHDPLAACCAIDESIATWAEVELYRKQGEWGSKLAPGSQTWIITDYHHEKFMETLLSRSS